MKYEVPQRKLAKISIKFGIPDPENLYTPQYVIIKSIYSLDRHVSGSTGWDTGQVNPIWS